MTVRKRVRAHGRVQGVFFRDSLRRAAAREGVAGWAANRPDGTVEAVLEGEPEAVERLVALCPRGPPPPHFPPPVWPPPGPSWPPTASPCATAARSSWCVSAPTPATTRPRC